jgi:hypothetical protein
MTRIPASQLPCLIMMILLITVPLFSQDNLQDSPEIIPLPENEKKEIDWNQIHMLGLSYQQSYKAMDVVSGSDTEELNYGIQSLGVNYGSFSGSRLGFYSDLYLQLPFLSNFESDATENNSGFSLDYIGSVGWSLWAGSIGFLPYLGFHTQYTFLSKDPLDENQSNHMLSFGMGAGLKILIKINEKNNIYAGVKGSLDTIEFTSASYDSREIQLRNKMSYMASIGYAYTAPTIIRVLQSDEFE